MHRYLLFATELYSIPILRPLADAARARGDTATWLTSVAVARRLPADEPRLSSAAELSVCRADAVFSPLHWVPPQLPGHKVQVFHGLSIDKRNPSRGHFRIRGLYDLYCTHGPATTAPFTALARRHGHFAVEETGWPKLDPLFADEAPDPLLRERAGGRTIVAYASTFTHGLSSAPALLETLKTLIDRGDRYWLLTLHPKSDPALIAAYRLLAGPHADFIEPDDLLRMLRGAEVMLCDTSSVIEEFALLRKPIVTLRTRVPKPFLLDVAYPEQIDAAIDTALRPPALRMQAMETYARQIHPSRDGHASDRVLDATERLLAGDYVRPRQKPINLWRRYQSGKKLRALMGDGAAP